MDSGGPAEFLGEVLEAHTRQHADFWNIIFYRPSHTLYVRFAKRSMTRSTLLVLLVVVCAHWLLAERPAAAQPAELPRLEYYVARDLYDAGNIGDATEGFRVSLNRGHQVNGQRWVDAVPAMVMLGECYYQQGAIAQALQQYDAALNICLAFPNWPDAIRSPENLPEVTDNKGINWTKLSRSANLIRVPGSLQIAVDPTQARFNADGVLIPGGTAIMRLDVPEVMRCLAVALLRRTHLLGPLAPFSPMSQQAMLLFSREPGHRAAWMQTGWKGLQGLSLIALNDDAKAIASLTAGASIDGRTDYFLTPACLIGLASIEFRQSKDAAALTHLGDASLRAAQLEQADMLAESLNAIGQMACANRRSDLLPILVSVTQWSRSYAVLPFMSGSAAVSELAVVAGNIPAHENAATQMLTVLRGKDNPNEVVALPRLQAQLGFALARAAAASNLSAVAEGHLEKSMSMLRGTQATGEAVPRVFQTQLAIELANGKQLKESDAEVVFQSLLSEPTVEQWRRWPLECLVSITTNHLPACEKSLELAVTRKAGAEAIERMGTHQLQRFHMVLPMGGRLLAARNWMQMDKASWPADMGTSLEGMLKSYPAVRTLPLAIRDLLDVISREPMVIDDKSISAESKKKLAELARHSEAAEAALMNLALQRISLSRDWPSPATLSDVQSTLKGDDALIAFVHTPTKVYGTVVTKGEQQVWMVPESPGLDAKIAMLLTQIGLAAAPNLDTGPNVPWRGTAKELSKLLIPDAARQLVAASNRVIVIPSGNLWYLPFDLLPLDSKEAEPMLARHPVCYLPTLAHCRQLESAAPTVRNTVGLYNSFFMRDRAANLGLCNQVGKELKQSMRLDMQQKSSLASPSYIRLRADQVWVASELPMGSTPWELKVFPLEPSRENALANWMQSPLRAPSRLYLPGLQTSASKVELKGGQEIFIPACTFMAAGTKSVWMSRWKVGGRSAHTALDRLLDEIQFESPSSAWQRAAIALWAEELPTSDEPILPGAKALPSTISGQHPLLWSGYLMLGDHRTPGE